MQFDVSQISFVPDDPSMRIGAAALNALQYCPPASAPLQQEHIPVRPLKTAPTVDRRCAWYPICDRMISDCGGVLKDQQQ